MMRLLSKLLRRPKLSVIVIVYDMSREAPRTLQSLAVPYQTGIAVEDYEVIVVDNGPHALWVKRRCRPVGFELPAALCLCAGCGVEVARSGHQPGCGREPREPWRVYGAHRWSPHRLAGVALHCPQCLQTARRPHRRHPGLAPGTGCPAEVGAQGLQQPGRGRPVSWTASAGPWTATGCSTSQCWPPRPTKVIPPRPPRVMRSS